MPVNASIYGQVGQGAEKPLNQLDAMTNAYALQNAQLSGQAKQQEFNDDQTLRSAYKTSGGDSNKLLQLLYGAGLGKQATALQKSQLDADKIRGDIAKDSATT